MNNQTTINNIFDLIAEKRLGPALRLFGNLTTDRLFVQLSDRYERIMGDYSLMLDYMMRNCDDPEREKLYLNLLQRLYTLNIEADVIWRNRNVDAFIQTAQRVARQNISDYEIRQRIERFVADEAMLQLDDNDDRREDEKDRLHREHTDFTQWLFDSVIVSGAWNDDRMLFMQNLLLAPTIDNADAALIISAITLSCLNTFDPHKWLSLVKVYQNATNERIKQRALVGWVLSLPQNAGIFGEVGEALEQLTADENTVNQLFQLQRQIFLTMNAENDMKQIQQDIMPNIIKNNNLNLSRFGIGEQDDDPLRDILDPDAEDRAMEEIEESVQRMMDMHKAGADIYFGGFSMMKRFGFFFQIANWFRLFDPYHPELSHTRRKMKNTNFLDVLSDNGPFCDSDKYSFALAMASVIDRIPQEMQEMMGQAEMFGPVGDQQVMSSPAYLRRMYLQDLFRFFRLSDNKTAFRDPFGKSGPLFITNKMLAPYLPTDRVIQLGAMLQKQKRYDHLRTLLNSYEGKTEQHSHDLLEAACLMHEKKYNDAAEKYKAVLDANPDDRSCLASLARAYYHAGNFTMAADYYSRLNLIVPDNISYAIFLAMALIKKGDTAKAVNLLYQYHLENEDNTRVMRVLAWALLAEKKAEQACRFYRQILEDDDDVTPDDHLNAAYGEWINGNRQKAAELLGQYLEEVTKNNTDKAASVLYEAIMADYNILNGNGISKDEISMMIDIVMRISQ